MYKLIFSFSVILSVMSSSAFSFLPNECNFGSPSDHGFDISSLSDKYKEASNFMSRGVYNNNTIETGFVDYVMLDTGVSCHVAYYTDGYIATALNGTETGKQIIVVNNIVTGVSYDVEHKRDHFIHKYTWGKVFSYSNKQIVHTY